MKLRTSLTLAIAQTIMTEALRLGRAEDMMPLTIVILDAGGKIIAVNSEDGSGLVRFDVAFGKAWGSLGMGKSSRWIRDNLETRPVFLTSLVTASDGRTIPVPGGVLIGDSEGFIIGAVGISGDTSERDEYLGISAVQAAGLGSEPAEVDPNWDSSSLSGPKK